MPIYLVDLKKLHNLSIKEKKTVKCQKSSLLNRWAVPLQGLYTQSVQWRFWSPFLKTKNFEESLRESERPHTPLTHTFLES